MNNHKYKDGWTKYEKKCHGSGCSSFEYSVNLNIHPMDIKYKIVYIQVKLSTSSRWEDTNSNISLTNNCDSSGHHFDNSETCIYMY